MIHRILEDKIHGELFKGKAIVIFGPRQAGKTTLVKSIVSSFGESVKWLNGDESDVRDLFNDPTSDGLKLISGNARIMVIDEAQRIRNIGLAIKLLVDIHPEIQVIATGSSSFELANEIKEPLTGRKFEHFLFPYSGNIFCSSKRLTDFMGKFTKKAVYLQPIVPLEYFINPKDKNNSENINVTFLGRIDPRKGIKNVIDLFNEIRSICYWQRIRDHRSDLTCSSH